MRNVGHGNPFSCDKAFLKRGKKRSLSYVYTVLFKMTFSCCKMNIMCLSHFFPDQTASAYQKEGKARYGKRALSPSLPPSLLRSFPLYSRSKHHFFSPGVFCLWS